MHIGFTGTRHMHPNYEAYLKRKLPDVVPSTWGSHEELWFITGGCIGVDEFVAKWCLDQYPANTYPDVHHKIILPDDLSRVNTDWITEMIADPRVKVEQLGYTYAERNRAIVAESSRLTAFPEYPEHHPRSKRSGTWMTVRMARQGKVPYKAYCLGVVA